MDIVLIDGMHLCYRMFHSHKALYSSEGEPTGMIYGVLNNLLAIQNKFQKSPVIFCWDKGTSWRRAVASYYKAKRASSTSFTEVDRKRMLLQLARLKEEFVSVIGLPQLEVESIEGDDIIGILSYQLEQLDCVDEIFIYSGDKDFNQLLTDKVSILKPVMRAQGYEIVTPKVLRRTYGISPRDWVKMRALAGDASDGLKALANVGPHRATAMLAMGVDPSQPQATAGLRPSARGLLKKQAREIEEQWGKIHEVYQLSMIPRRSSDIKVAADIRQELDNQIADVYKNPFRRVIQGGGDLISKRLTQYEMMSLLIKRRLFFNFPVREKSYTTHEETT